MSNENKKEDTNTEIMNENDYIVLFGSEKEIQKEALKNALDIRKFEIEMYWKRASYFWALIAVSYAGYFTFLSGENTDECLLLFISTIGFNFSCSWYFVNRGSKFWQNNWERHVDYLENKVMGPLYKTVKNPNEFKLCNLTEAYPMSVSKINQISSLFVSITWVLLIFYSMVINEWFDKFSIFQKTIITVIFTAFIIFIYVFFGKSKIIKNKDRNKKPKFIIRNLE